MAYLSPGIADPASKDNLTNGFSEKTEYKLYVTNLPPELNEDGIRQIFNSYGDVTGILSPQEAGWAFVTYRTHREALLAIGKLDEKSPLHLKVEFSKERQAKNIQDWKKQNVSQSDIAVETAIASDYRDSGGFSQRNNASQRRLDVSLPETLRSKHNIPEYDFRDDILYPVENDPRTLNPFENAVPYPETNLLWTRGRLAVANDGRRHVYMGRGYTYQIPDPYPQIEDNVSSLYERRINGLYEYGVDQFKNEIGKCELCSTTTKMRCSKCSIFYCSRTCQKTDWEKHKIECQALPPLTGIPNSINPLTSGDEQLQRSNIRVKPDMIERVNILNQRAKESSILKQQTEKEKKDVSLKASNDVQQETKCLDREMNNIRVSEMYGMKHSKLSEACEPEASVLQMKCPQSLQQVDFDESKKASIDFSQNHEKAQNKSRKFINDHERTDEDVASHKNTFLTKNKFTKVVVTSPLGIGEAWVQRLEDTDEFTTMMTVLKNSPASPTVKPIVGNLISCKFYDIWHRASVVSLNPLTVHYIDYGNNEILENNDIRELGTLQKIPRYARRISIKNAKGTRYEKLKEDDQLDVKMVSVSSEGVFEVITQEQEGMNPRELFSDPHNGLGSQHGPDFEKKQNSQERNKQTLPEMSLPGYSKEVISQTNSILEDLPTPTGSIIHNLEPEYKGMLEFHALLSKNTYSVTLVPKKFLKFYERLLNEIPAKCAELAKSKNYQPKEVGECIFGKRADGDWARGRILSVGPPIKVAFIDEGRVCLVDHCLHMPTKISEICTFAATCELLTEDFKDKALESASFLVLDCKKINGQIALEVMLHSNIDSEKPSCRAILTEWKPTPEQAGVELLKLNSDIEVALTAYRSQSLLYVRSLENKEVERFNRLLQEVARRAQTASRMKNPPVVGEMVIAKFKEDGNHYRAIITKVDGDSFYITYVDFGNVEISSPMHFLELPTELKQCPSGAAKIVLKGVPNDVPMTEEVSQYFAMLVGREQPLKITFDGIPSKDGVELKTASGENVNEKVKQLLTPNWKKISPEEEKTCFTLGDLKTVNLGNVGETVNAVVLHSPEEGNTYMMCPLDVELITHVSKVLPVLVQNYVNSTKEHYIPRDQEMCIAPFDGTWYRAACLARNATPISSSIFFVDYGNIEEVPHVNLRLMPKDFMTPEALACICTVQNLLPEKIQKEMPQQLKERLANLLAPNNPIKVKIINVDDAGAYRVQFPEIREILQKENLI